MTVLSETHYFIVAPLHLLFFVATSQDDEWSTEQKEFQLP